MSYEALKDNKKKTESLYLKDFVSKYQLPQIVTVETGYYDVDDSINFSNGEKIKLHSVENQLTACCYDKHGLFHQIPVKTKELIALEEDQLYCETLGELITLIPLPRYTIIQNGYSPLMNNGEGGICIESEDKLEILINKHEIALQKRRNFLTLRNEEGIVFDLSLSCKAGFKPLYSPENYYLSDILPTKAEKLARPVYFRFTNAHSPQSNLRVLKCEEVRDMEFVTASGEDSTKQNKMSVPLEFQIKVKLVENAREVARKIKDVAPRGQHVEEIEKHVETPEFDQIYEQICEKSCPITKQSTPSPSISEKIKFFASKQHSQAQDSEHLVSSENIYTPLVGIFQIDDSSGPTGTQSAAMKNIPMEKDDSQKKVAKIDSMTVGEICNALKELKLQKHIKTFKENLIDGRFLCSLTEEEFKVIGLNKFEIKKLLIYRDGWRPKL